MADQTEQEQMLSIIQNRVERASQGKWTACRMTHAERGGDLTPEELGEYVMNSVRKSAEASGSSTFLFISVEKADGQPADVCHVGNGPTSPQNADFIQHAPDDVRYLLALLRERDAQVARLSAQVEQQERANQIIREEGVEARAIIQSRDIEILKLNRVVDTLRAALVDELLRDAAQQQIEKAVDDEQRRIATHVWEKLVPIGVDATDSDGSDTEDPARHIVSWVVGLHDRVSGELVAAQQEAKALREALTKLRDCDWTIGRGDRMDAVRDIARAALQSTRPQEQP